MVVSPLSCVSCRFCSPPQGVAFAYMKKINRLNANYTVIPLELLEDQKLSWKAKGLAAYICHLDSAKIEPSAKTLDLWRTCVYTESLDAYDELVAAGYIEDVISKHGEAPQ